jgi:hypothetical protein
MISKNVKIVEGYEVREFGGEFHIIDTSKITQDIETFDCVATLNETGLFLWSNLLEHKTPDDLVALLSQKDSVEEDEAESDVVEFLAKLKNAKAIELYITH